MRIYVRTELDLCVPLHTWYVGCLLYSLKPSELSILPYDFVDVLQWLLRSQWNICKVDSVFWLTLRKMFISWSKFLWTYSIFILLLSISLCCTLFPLVCETFSLFGVGLFVGKVWRIGLYKLAMHYSAKRKFEPPSRTEKVILCSVLFYQSIWYFIYLLAWNEEFHIFYRSNQVANGGYISSLKLGYFAFDATDRVFHCRNNCVMERLVSW